MWRCRILCATISCVKETVWGGGGVECGTEELTCKWVSGGEFQVQVIQADGLPEVPLTIFGNEMLSILSQGSVRAYLREVVAFANWAGSDQVARLNAWGMYGDPREVRNLIREYLTVVGECRITQRPDTLGVRA